MGVEKMRRWPMYIMFAVCILLTLSLFNSWTLEAAEQELRNKVAATSTHLHECAKQLQVCNKDQTSCIEESVRFLNQKQWYQKRFADLEKEKTKLSEDVTEIKNAAVKAEIQVNRTLIDVDLCRTELQSLKNLQLSKSATLETLRLEKETLQSELSERKAKIEGLEKEIERLTLALKSMPELPASKVTKAPEPPQISPSLNVHNPINEPVLENNAKEDLEETNLQIDSIDAEPQL